MVYALGTRNLSCTMQFVNISARLRSIKILKLLLKENHLILKMYMTLMLLLSFVRLSLEVLPHLLNQLANQIYLINFFFNSHPNIDLTCV